MDSSTTDYRPQTAQYALPARPVFIALLLLVPLLLSVAWGVRFHQTAYTSLRFAQHVMVGRPLTFDGQITPLPQSAVMLAVLSLAGTLLPLATAATIWTGSGWGVAALVLFYTQVKGQRPYAGLFSALLLILSPVVLLTAGTEMGWLLAACWLALSLAWQRKWKWQTAVLFCLPLIHFSWGTVVLLLFFWIWRWLKTETLPWKAGLIWLAGVMIWPLFLSGLFGWRMVVNELNLIGLKPPFGQLFFDNEFYWLFLPLIGLGIWYDRVQRLPVIFCWLLILLFGEPLWAGAMTAVTGLYFAGLGVEWLREWLAPRVEGISERKLGVVVAVTVGLPLLLAQLRTSQNRYQLDPPATLQIEAQIGAWLADNSPATALVFASPRLGYLADRAVWSEAAVDLANLPPLLADVQLATPDYFVTDQSLGWQLFPQTGWFQERFQQVAQFESAANVAAPYTVWAFQPSAFDAGTRQEASGRTDHDISVTGYQLSTNRPEPGEPIYLTLYLQATDTVTAPVRMTLQMTAVPDGHMVWQETTARPTSLPLSWWQPGQTVPERFILSPEALPAGAYALNLSFSGEDEIIWPIYQGEDTVPLERLQLDAVAVLAAGLPDKATAVAANFADQIGLQAVTLLGSAEPGSMVTINLYWEALAEPDENWTVFVHLLAEDGEFIAGDDRIPLNGRFPTNTWQTGDIIPDPHSITLPPDLEPGHYIITVGLYLLETGERLPVRDSNGRELPDRSLPIAEIEIP